MNSSFDIELINKTKVLIIGIGGAFGILDLLAKIGVVNFTLIDYDYVEKKNISIQGYQFSDIGSAKVIAAKKSLLKAYPNVKCKIYNLDFNNLSTKVIHEIYQQIDFAFYMTDDFFAQAKGNLISLKFKIPSIWASLFCKGKGAEVVYTIPGVTPYCYRCQTSQRYKAYKDGYINNVTSVGSNIIHNAIVNSIICHIFLTIMNNNNKSEASSFYGQINVNNYISLKMHPDFDESLEPFNIKFKNLKAKDHQCKDCRDIGNLKDASVNIHDFNVSL